MHYIKNFFMKILQQFYLFCICLMQIIPFYVVADTIRGINWFGFETGNKALMCTWAKDTEYYLDKLVELQFNYIRLPFSLQYVYENDFSKMDEFFDLAEKNNISVLYFTQLQNHSL